MKRRTVDYVIILGMGISGCYVLFTGMIMDILHLPMIVFHDIAGYVCGGFALIHLLRFLRRVTDFLGIQAAR